MSAKPYCLATICTHSGAYRVSHNEGRINRIEDLHGDPMPSAIGRGLIGSVESKARIRRPAVRESFLHGHENCGRSKRGSDRFLELPWDEALDLAALHLGRIYREHGPAAVFGGSYGWASAGRFHHALSQVHRFLNTLGGYTASEGTYSHAALEAICPFVVGEFTSEILKQATTWPNLARNTELFVLFGGLAVKNAQIAAGGATRHIVQKYAQEAHARGAEFISVSPQQSDCPEELQAEWLQIVPGTDTALMLALAHVLLSEDLHDRAFLERCCVGFDRFVPYLTGAADGQPKSPEWAAGICGIGAYTIRKLARKMASSRCLINMAWSLQRADNGEQPGWMTIVLAAMLGQIGLPGGGFGLGYSSDNGVGHPVGPLRYGALPQGQNPVEQRIPVARIADALLNPGGEYHYKGSVYRYPNLKAVYWAGGNPFHHHQDLNRLRVAFAEPELIIVNEMFWTATARHADIVFPVTSPLERNDIAMGSYDAQIVVMNKIMEPVGEARDDYDVFCGLARRLGTGQAFSEGCTAEEWVARIWTQTRSRAAAQGIGLPDLEALRRMEVYDNAPSCEDRVLFAGFRADPGGNPLSTPSGRIEIFSETIAGFGLPDVQGHPVWQPPFEWLGSNKARQYPLHLISNQPAARLHSQYDAGPISQKTKISGREPVTMHPDDAKVRGLKAGDAVRIYNERGACLAGLVLSERIRRGVVQIATGAWFDPSFSSDDLCKHGNPNVLTRDIGTSRLGQGPTAMTVLVDIEKCETPAEVTAFDPPLKG